MGKNENQQSLFMTVMEKINSPDRWQLSRKDKMTTLMKTSVMQKLAQVIGPFESKCNTFDFVLQNKKERKKAIFLLENLSFNKIMIL